jgi:hypothetical protein
MLKLQLLARQRRETVRIVHLNSYSMFHFEKLIVYQKDQHIYII